MDKKLPMFLLSLFVVTVLSSMQGFAVTELTSCGKNSGWTNGETYLLNFSNVGSGYGNSWCFDFPYDNMPQDIRFVGNGETITVDKSGGFDFFFTVYDGASVGASRMRNFTFENLSVKMADDIILNDTTFIRWANNNNDLDQYAINTKIHNVTVSNFDHFFWADDSNSQKGFYNGNIDNLVFIGDQFMTGMKNLDSTTNVPPFYISGTDINNTLVMTNQQGIKSDYIDTYGGTTYGTSQWSNSVIIYKDESITTGDVSYTSSLIKGYPHNDSDNDGIADTDLYPSMTNMVIWETIDGIRYLQDTSEGKQGFQSDEEHFVVNDQDSAFTDGTEYPQINGAIYYFNNFFVTANLTGIGAINLDTDSRMEIYPFEPNNDLLSVQPGGISSSGDYRGMIRVSDNSTISGIRFGHTGAEPTLAQFLSNINGGNTVTDFEFTNNQVLTYGYNSSTGGGQFRLRTNNADIYDNIFTPITTTGREESFLNITGFEDTIHKNQFSVSGNGTYYLCAFCSGGQEFYNNNISENVRVAKSGYVPDIELNTTVAYEEGGTVYYFNIGNYWVGNTNCTDGNGDGICDSQYVTPNGFVDERPLAEYPFDFSAQKLNADETVTESNFTVTLVEPLDGDSYTLSDSSDAIDVSFIHDSDYSDLTCDFVIDGVVEDRLSSPEKNVTNTLSFTGWSEGNHTARVECYNDFIFDASPTNTFTVSISGDTSDNGTGDDGTGLDPGGITGNNGQIITGDVEQTRNNVISMFGLFNLPLVYGAYLGLVFIAIVFLIVLFSAIYMLIPKK